MDRRTMVSTRRRRAIQTMIFTTVCFLVPLPEVEGRTLGGCRLTNVPSASLLSPPFSNRMPTNNNTISRMEQTSSRQWRRRPPPPPPPSPNQPNNDKEEEARSIPTRIQQLRAGGRSDLRSSSTNNNTNNSSRRLGNLEHNVSVIVALLASLFRTVVPPVIIGLRAFGAVYRALPTDVLLAQAGLVYCFAGGYYPTLFAALSAAQHCGWHTMVQAVDDLFTEATHAMEVVATAADMEPNTHTDTDTDHIHDLDVDTDTEREPTQKDSPNDEPFPSRQAKKDLFVQQTKIVLATIDPIKINQAVGALYTTWMGVSSVLEREFAKTIALSLTIVEYLRPLTRLVVEPPIYWLLPDVYHRWVPILVGWGCKGTAMSVAWRLQRILTAYTSAITGGLMFARATMRMLVKNTRKKKKKRGKNRNDDHDYHDYDDDPDYYDYDDHDRETSSSIEEVIGFVVAGIGLHTQIGNGFNFKVPHPLSLVTWPFDILEKWIQWQITKDSK